MSKLLIVESPKKIKTLRPILPGFTIATSVGHITKLKKVDVADNFNMVYAVDPAKKDVVKKLSKEAKYASEIYLATDDDREGEKIAEAILEFCIPKKTNAQIHRVKFKSLTKNTVLEEIKNPTAIDYDKVHSQEARRCIDRLMGFGLSGLTRVAVGSLSAGRVQSVALKLIVDREREIEAFIPETYYEVLVFDKENTDKPIEFKYWGDTFDTEKKSVKHERINDIEKVNQLRTSFDNNPSTIHSVVKKERHISPPKPFETSQLIRKANSELSFTAKKTMFVAQQLYQGFNDFDENEPIAWITYMRTDSLRIEEGEQDKIIKYLNDNGQETTGRLVVKTKKGEQIQDGHEAIRPTLVDNSPEKMKRQLGGEHSDHFKLYDLIWRTTCAAFMKPAVMLDNILYLKNGDHYYRNICSEIKESNFFNILPRKEKGEDEKIISKSYNDGDVVNASDFKSLEKKTQPPPRYTESSLIRVFKKEGIGRPSTYQSIFDKIINVRHYVEKEKKSASSPLKPTKQGVKTSDFLQENFSEWINEKYTSEMELKLDKIANKEKTYYEVVKGFYFDDNFERKVKDMKEQVKDDSILDEKCPKCDHHLQKKTGKFGEFISCSNYKNCDWKPPKTQQPREEAGRDCPECGGKLLKKTGRYGEFVGCENYPTCKFIEKKNGAKPASKTGVKCDKCSVGEFVERSGKNGKFYACNQFPKCRNTKNNLKGLEVNSTASLKPTKSKDEDYENIFADGDDS